MPRARVTLTPKDLLAIERMAGHGLPLDEIAHALGFAPRTLDRRVADTEAVAEAMARGKAKARSEIGAALLKKAKLGDVPAIRWFEATRFGLSEKQQHEHSGPAGGPLEVHVVRRVVRPESS